MKYKLICLLLTGLFIWAVHPGIAQINYNDIDWGVHPMDYSSVGTAGWQFLKLPSNARNASLGGVQSSISFGDANSAFTNPASLADVENMDFSFNYMEWVADISYNSVSAVKNFRNIGTFGLNLIFVDYGEEIRTEYHEEQLISDVIYTPVMDGLGTFSANDMAIGLAFARQITDKLQVGANVKYLQEQIDDARTSVWSLDVGTMFYTGFKTLRVSMLGKQFGPDAEFRDYAYRVERVPFRMKLPMYLSIGAAIDLLEKKPDSPHHMILAMDYVVPNDAPKKINAGTEYVFMNTFALRCGYRFNYDEEGLTLGAGLNYAMGGFKMKIDYAFVDVGLFEQVHMFSIGLSL